MLEYIVECTESGAIYMTKTEYNQIYNKNNYKQLNLKIPTVLSDEFSNFKKEYGSAPKVLEASLNALKDFNNLQIENENLKTENSNLQKNIVELQNILNDKKENNISENNLVLEVVDENEKLKNEIIQLKTYNTELKNALSEKLTYDTPQTQKGSSKIFIFLIGVIVTLTLINFMNILKF